MNEQLTLTVWLQAIKDHGVHAREYLLDLGYHWKVIYRKAEKSASRGYTEYGVVADRPWLTPKGERWLADSLTPDDVDPLEVDATATPVSLPDDDPVDSDGQPRLETLTGHNLTWIVDPDMRPGLVYIAPYATAERLGWLKDRTTGSLPLAPRDATRGVLDS